MKIVNSVLGELPTAKLGFTLMHEHVSVGSAGVQQTYPEFLNREQILEEGVRELSRAYSEGVRTIVDLTTMDLGRDIGLIEEVSRRSGVNIIAATGIWRDIPRVFWTASPDDIAPLFIREITEGIDGTDIKAGIIKVANDVGGVTPEGEVILRAAARAHKATRVPISTHTWALERVGDQQVEIFEDEGVDLNRVYIGHCNDTQDMDYLIGLLKKGVWLGLDRYPGGMTPSTPDNLWEQRTETAKRLIEEGYARRIMISHDWSVPTASPSQEIRRRRKQYNPDGYLFVTRRVLPQLRELGISDSIVHQILMDNPRHFFEAG